MANQFIEINSLIIEVIAHCDAVTSINIVGKKEAEQPNHITNIALLQLEQYFQGKRKNFYIPIDTSASSKLHQEVLKELQKIQYGTTVSYQTIANNIDRPKAVRAVANEIGKNEFLIVIPCHRVIRSDGTIGGFRAGIELKEKLLNFEKMYKNN